MTLPEQRQVFLARYKSFSVKRTGVLAYPYPKLGARYEVERDLSPLFPYINSSVEGAQYLDSPERIQFVLDGIQCTLYSHEIITAAFNDHDHAKFLANSSFIFLMNWMHRRLRSHQTIARSPLFSHWMSIQFSPRQIAANVACQVVWPLPEH